MASGKYSRRKWRSEMPKKCRLTVKGPSVPIQISLTGEELLKILLQQLEKDDATKDHRPND
jgi:hypothetical protein